MHSEHSLPQALVVLTYDEGASVTMATAKVHEAMLAAMEAHAENAFILYTACRCVSFPSF